MLEQFAVKKEQQEIHCPINNCKDRNTRKYEKLTTPPSLERHLIDFCKKIQPNKNYTFN